MLREGELKGSDEGSVFNEESKNRACMVMGSETSGALHPLELIGIDTCSALSVSTEESDFWFLDKSAEARNSVAIRGVGGKASEIIGRGPMVIETKDKDGNKIVMVDPAGVLLRSSNTQGRLRIFGQQRMRNFGFNLVQEGEEEDGKDFLRYRNLQIPLVTNSGILMLETSPSYFSPFQHNKIDGILNRILGGERGLNCLRFEGDKNVIPVLVSGLTEVEEDRLQHWRHAHRSLTGNHARESCPACNEAKWKSKSFKRNEIFQGTTIKTNTVLWRLYSDGYGGQNSMGELSYQGAKGGFVFLDPVSGMLIPKLYASSDQYPAILYQVHQEVESLGYCVREIFVDTYAVNLSKAAEEVCEMFKSRIVPISAGTPQELAYAESAVRVLAQMARALLLGAPHLPEFCWGLADLYAAYIHKILPQKSRGGKSPYELVHGRKPDKDLLFIKVFGCPCQYAPMSGPEHKRGRKTEWGWFVGIQWPMALVLRPGDNKVISVSRKKLICHERMYATFDFTRQSRPQITFADFKLDEDEVDEAIQKADSESKLKNIKKSVPDHVMSVKSLSDYERNSSFNDPNPVNMPKRNMEAFNSPQLVEQGEKSRIPDNLREQYVDLLEEIQKVNLNNKNNGDSRTEAIVKALKKVEEEISNEGPRKNFLTKTSVPEKTKPGIDKKNIILSKRRRNDVTIPGKNKKSRFSDLHFVKGDRVKIRTFRFGRKYSVGKPKWTYGTVLRVKGFEKNICSVIWDGSSKDEAMDSHRKHLVGVDDDEKVLFLLSDKEKFWCEDREKVETPCGNLTSKILSLLPILEVGSSLSSDNDEFGGSVPKDFYEALVRPDWRQWVEAVKSENDSWNMFGASQEVAYEEMEVGASVIPLGELFTIKRSGKYKFRQYAMGNLLKEGRDYGETFSSTVSGDGLRWFCSLASTCGKEIRGWDATTGYLQTEQRIPVYAYLPSHHGFSCLSFEELATLRANLIKILKNDGIKGIRNFSRDMRKERRFRPKTVLKLNKSVYGIPDAGQSFSMFMQALHLKKGGMVQSEMDPCIFYKILQDCENKVVTDFLVVITWVDDCRYFGTSKMVREYEEVITKNCKCTLEGVCTEFVSIQIHHDLQRQTLELTQETYWEKAVERFKMFLKDGKPKERRVPLSPADEKLLVVPTNEEIEDAKELPYPSLLGVVQYPSAYSKLEMRFAMSVLSRHRTKWGRIHFEILIKALEYGFTTRKMGVVYSGWIDNKEKNVLIGYADSGFSLPRSQGCRLVIMNGAAISYTSKRHTITDDSTTSAEITEQYLCSCDIEGFRNLLAEIGLKQEEPTIIYQDNKAAIQIAMNRGSLSKKTRAMEIKTLTIRNKIEDMKVVPIYIETTKMIADIGTKALDPRQFEALRDLLCGYTILRAHEQGKEGEYLSALCAVADRLSKEF